MSEIPNPIVHDQAVDSHALLKQLEAQPGKEISLTGLGVQELSLDALQPLEENDAMRKLASFDLGDGTKIDAWFLVDGEGNLDQSALYLAQTGVDISEAMHRGQTEPGYWHDRVVGLPGNEGMFTVGRDQPVVNGRTMNNVLGVGKQGISRKHVGIGIEGGTLLIEDYSTNGTGFLAEIKPSEAENQVDVKTHPRSELKDIIDQTGGAAVASEAIVVNAEPPAEDAPEQDLEPKEAPPKELDMNAIFASGEAFANALHDSQLDPDVRSGLKRLAETWKDLKIAATTTEVWDEMIMPKLRELSNVIRTVKPEADNIADSAAQLARLFTDAAYALEGNDHGTFATAMRAAFEPTQNFRHAFGGNDMKGAQDLQHAAVLLSVEEVEGDHRIELLNKRVEYGDIDQPGADALVTKVGLQINILDDLDTAIESLKSELPAQTNWRQRQEAIQVMSKFAQAANNSVVVDFRDVVRMRNSLDLISDSLSSGRYTSDMLFEAATNARNVNKAFDQVRHLIDRSSAELNAL